MKLVSNANQVRENISVLQQEAITNSALPELFGFVHVWYIDAEKPEEPKFGPSKFIGYEGMDAATYLQNYKNMDGRDTEVILPEYAHELNPDTPTYRAYFSKLCDWLAGFGKTPRKSVRLMVLDQTQMDPLHTPTEDRCLLDLLLAVAETLPLHQKMELRGRL